MTARNFQGALFLWKEPGRDNASLWPLKGATLKQRPMRRVTQYGSLDSVGVLFPDWTLIETAAVSKPLFPDRLELPTASNLSPI